MTKGFTLVLWCVCLLLVRLCVRVCMFKLYLFLVSGLFVYLAVIIVHCK